MNEFARTYALDDIEVSRSGDGRTVTAYAAVFGTAAEVRDAHGHYNEVIARSAFDKTLRERGADRISVMFNHGFTEHGTPSDLGSVPVARCMEIKADAKGLLTVSRYNKSALADAVLESIRNGEIRGQSFRGRIYQSSPGHKAPRVRPGQPLPTITRTELGLTEYGPTRAPVYEAAEILAVRSAPELAAELADLDRDALAEVMRTLTGLIDPSTRESEPDGTTGTGLPAAEAESPKHSARVHVARARLRRALALNGVFPNG